MSPVAPGCCATSSCSRCLRSSIVLNLSKNNAPISMGAENLHGVGGISKFLTLLCEFCCEFAGTRLNQNGAVRKNNGGNTPHTAIYLHYIVSSSLILFDIDIFVGNAMSIKPAFRHTAITTPARGIHLDYFLLVCRMRQN